MEHCIAPYQDQVLFRGTNMDRCLWHAVKYKKQAAEEHVEDCSIRQYANNGDDNNEYSYI